MDNLNELLRRVELMRRLPVPNARRRLRERAGLTRDEVAAVLGVSATAVYAWETGKSEPGKQHIEAYLNLLDELATG